MVFVWPMLGAKIPWPTDSPRDSPNAGWDQDNGNIEHHKSREFSGLIHVITSNNHPSNPQQPIQQPYVKRTSKLLSLQKCIPCPHSEFYTPCHSWWNHPFYCQKGHVAVGLESEVRNSTRLSRENQLPADLFQPQSIESWCFRWVKPFIIR